MSASHPCVDCSEVCSSVLKLSFLSLFLECSHRHLRKASALQTFLLTRPRSRVITLKITVVAHKPLTLIEVANPATDYCYVDSAAFPLVLLISLIVLSIGVIVILKSSYLLV